MYLACVCIWYGVPVVCSTEHHVVLPPPYYYMYPPDSGMHSGCSTAPTLHPPPGGSAHHVWTYGPYGGAIILVDVYTTPHRYVHAGTDGLLVGVHTQDEWMLAGG